VFQPGQPNPVVAIGRPPSTTSMPTGPAVRDVIVPSVCVTQIRWLDGSL
jgi:hypothetical protein